MSQELASSFFQRDLSEVEMDALEASLERDGAVAERLLAGAAEHYRATGLPEPRWDERRKGKGGVWVLGALAALGLGYWTLSRPVPLHPVSVVSEAEGELPLRERTPLVVLENDEPIRATAPIPAAPESRRQGLRLGVVLRLREPQHLSVVVADAQGRVCRALQSGRFPAGEARFEWDGLDGQGRALPAGTYQIKVQGPGVALSRKVELRARTVSSRGEDRS